MRVAFVQSTWTEYSGIMCLSGMLKAHASETTVFVAPAERDLVGEVSSWKPDLLACSVTTGEMKWAIETMSGLRRATGVPTVCGGPHPTVFPEIVQYPFLDYVCRGEGEHALLDLVRNLESKRPTDAIPNIWVERDGRIVANPPRPLVEDLDELPLADRSLYKKYRLISEAPLKHVTIGRGCPYTCTHCYNDHFHRLYGKGAFRLPSIERAYMEIEEILRTYRPITLVFDDDTFTARKPWLMEFLSQYPARVGLPFICNVHPATVSDEVAAALQKAGCFRICMGVESGSERLRTGILGKKVTNKRIEIAVKRLHRHGIKVLTNNMVGLPTETVVEAWETVEFNARIGTDYPWCSILQPYPRTEIERVCREMGLLPETPDHFAPTFFEGSILKQDNIAELVRVQKLFWFGVRFPSLMKLWKLLARLPLDRLLHVMFICSFGLRFMTSNRIPLRYMLKFSWFNLALYKWNKSPGRQGMQGS
jgi:tRNA A37 methylthiotransferase MiaB